DQTIAARYIVGSQDASQNSGPVIQGIMPCYPGTQVPLQFSYMLPIPYNQPLSLPLTTRYKINAFDVYTAVSSGLTIEDRGFTRAGQVEVQGQNYRHYLSGQSVAPRTAYTLTLITPQV